jgi:hypothetical protein
MIVHVMVVGAFEVSTEGKSLHPSEKIRVIGQYIFERAVPVARFAHQDAPGFLQYFRLNDSRPVSKISDLAFAPKNCLYCFAVAIRT